MRPPRTRAALRLANPPPKGRRKSTKVYTEVQPGAQEHPRHPPGSCHLSVPVKCAQQEDTFQDERPTAQDCEQAVHPGGQVRPYGGREETPQRGGWHRK